MRRSVVVCGVVVVASFAPPKVAHADPDRVEAVEVPAQSTPSFIDVAFDIGGVSSSNHSYQGGPEIGATLLARRWMLEAGPTFNGAAQLFSPTSRSDLGLLLGVGSEAWSFIGGDLLLEGGIRHYDDMGGCSFLCHYSGVSGNAPYVGLRAGATLHPLHAPRTVFVGGVWFSLSHDLSSRLVTFDYAGSGLFGPTSGSETVVIGGATEVGLSLRLGWDTRF
jgi:hypothetical protein